MPTPPTSSAARPTKVRYCVNCRIERSSCGETFGRGCGFPIRPPDAARARAGMTSATCGRSLRRAAGAPDRASGPDCPAAPVASRASASWLISSRGPNEMPPARFVRLGLERGADFKRRVADGQPRTGREIRAATSGPDRRPRRNASPRLASIAARSPGRLGIDCAVKRIGLIDRLHFDERCVAAGAVRAMARMVAVTLSAPKLAANARSCGRWPRAGSE